MFFFSNKYSLVTDFNYQVKGGLRTNKHDYYKIVLCSGLAAESVQPLVGSQLSLIKAKVFKQFSLGLTFSQGYSLEGKDNFSNVKFSEKLLFGRK